MSEVKEYKCPSCGASMYYDIEQKSLSCRFCKNTYDREYIISHFDEETNGKLPDFDWVKRSKTVWEPYVSDKIKEYDCPSCGGQIITLSSTATAKCPFCSHDLIISSNFKGDVSPDKIIPFEVTYGEFADKYTEYISERKEVPKEFKDKAALDNITGCYIPVWSYSCTCVSTIDSDYCSSITVKDYPILANDKNTGNREFYSMWPFDFSKADDFNESYLSGFYASRYIIGVENAMRYADYYIKEACPGREQYEAKYTKGSKINNNTSDPQKEGLKKTIHKREMTYYLVPVWLLNIKYKNRNYTVAMNGQTGKMCIDSLPENSFYHCLYKIIYLIIQLLELILGYLLLKDFFIFTEKLIIVLISVCVVLPIVTNVMFTSLICNSIFRKKRKKALPIVRRPLFNVRDFLE